VITRRALLLSVAGSAVGAAAAVAAPQPLGPDDLDRVAAGAKPPTAKPAVVTGVKGAAVCCQKKGATWKR
jgi:hypothetical protein